MSDIVIVSGARTPMGGFQGSLSGVSAVDLGAIAIREAVARAGGNLSAAARALGLTRPQLSYRLSRLNERAQP